MIEIIYNHQNGHVLPDGKIKKHCSDNIAKGEFSDTTGSEMTLLTYRALFKEKGISVNDVVFLIEDDKGNLHELKFENNFKLKEESAEHYPTCFEDLLYKLL